MIKAVPIDYMHAVCLGAMKRLLKFWVRGKQSTKIPSAKCDAVNMSLNYLKITSHQSLSGYQGL